MEVEEAQEIYVKPLTPKIALEYLKFKQKYEGKDFLIIWNLLTRKKFSEEELCQVINRVRERIIEVKNEGIQGDNAFNIIFDEICMPGMENTSIDLKEYKSLVGSLMTVYKNPKFKQFTENYTQDIVYVFDQIDKERAVKAEKHKKAQINKLEKQGKWLQKEEEKIREEGIVNQELFDIFSDLQSEYTHTKEAGYILTSDEKEDIFLQAWKEFKARNPSISKKEGDTIYLKFYTNYVY